MGACKIGYLKKSEIRIPLIVRAETVFGSQLVQVLNVHDSVIPELDSVLLCFLNNRLEDAGFGFHPRLAHVKLNQGGR